MADTLQLRGGTTSQHANFTGADREVTVDTTKKTLVVHHGGSGQPLMREEGNSGSLASSVKFATSGTDAIAIDSSQRVGINVGSPAEVLDVNGNIKATGNITITNSAPRVLLSDTDNFVDYTLKNDSGQFVVEKGGANGNLEVAGTIVATGNVGLGTTLPQAKLEIKGDNDGSNFDALNLRNAGSDGSDVTINMISSTDPANTAARSFIRSERDNAGSNLSFGTSNTSKLYINSSGNVGIGETDPEERLHLRTDGGEDTNIRFDTNKNTSKVKAAVVGEENNLILSANNNTSDMTISSLGVGIGTTATSSEKLHVNGNIKATGTVTCTSLTETSDIALKENIQPLSNTLEKLKQLTAYKYNFKSTETASMGVIAQDVEKIYPELVHGKEGTKSLQYSGLIGALIEAIKELSAKVEALEAA